MIFTTSLFDYIVELNSLLMPFLVNHRCHINNARPIHSIDEISMKAIKNHST
jgi:hypothetical protein